MSDVTRIGRRGPDRKDGLVLVPAPYSKCGHSKFILDERKAEVECADCGEKLNPIWVLGQIATSDSSVAMARDNLRKLVRQLSSKLKYKCRHCGKMNDMSRIVKIKR